MVEQLAATRLSDRQIVSRLELQDSGGEPIPSLNTIHKYAEPVRQRADSDPEITRSRLFYFPESMEEAGISWDDAPFAQELMRSRHRPSQRQVVWYARLRRMAPDAPTFFVTAMTRHLVVLEGLNRWNRYELRPIELWFSSAAWRSEEARTAYETSAREEGIEPWQPAWRFSDDFGEAVREAGLLNPGWTEDTARIVLSSVSKYQSQEAAR